eukprot:augustus_masked-scaffold_34-processed-gene-1.11-mRNA-1 protein AED:1.00 eAED:1.00 QI:0/-1/0/0/-1/1/1/0/214
MRYSTSEWKKLQKDIGRVTKISNSRKRYTHHVTDEVGIKGSQEVNHTKGKPTRYKFVYWVPERREYYGVLDNEYLIATLGPFNSMLQCAIEVDEYIIQKNKLIPSSFIEASLNFPTNLERNWSKTIVKHEKTFSKPQDPVEGALTSGSESIESFSRDESRGDGCFQSSLVQIYETDVKRDKNGNVAEVFDIILNVLVKRLLEWENKNNAKNMEK